MRIILKRFLLISVAVLSTLCSEAKADRPFEGVEALAAMSPKFPCGNMIRALRVAKRPALQVLWGTFGNDTSCIARYLDTFKDRPHFLEMDLTPEPYRRDFRSTSGLLLPTFSINLLNRTLTSSPETVAPAIIARVNRIREAIQPLINVNTVLVLNLGLEDNYTSGSYHALLSIVESVWDVLTVRNPNGHNLGADFSGSAFLELHTRGLDGSPFRILALDGFTLSMREQRRWVTGNRARNAAGLLLWEPEWQGLYDKHFPPPLKRTFRFDSKSISLVRNALR